VLKVPEKFIGIEGACNYCGARLTIQADVVASPPGSAETGPGEGLHEQSRYDASLPGEAPALESHSAHARQNLERLAKELESERIARLEADAAREVAEERVRHLERKVAETISQRSENALLRADLDRVEAKLAQSAREVQRLAEELEAARLTHGVEIIARSEALSTVADASAGGSESGGPAGANVVAAHVGPRTAAGRPISRGRRLVPILTLVIVVALLLAVSLWRPSTESLKTRIKPTLDMLRGKIASKGEPPMPVLPGGLDVTVSYLAPNAQSGQKEAPASDVPVLLIRQRLDRNLLNALFEEAGVPQHSWDAFADWYVLAVPDVKPDAPFADARVKLAALEERMGRDAFDARLLSATSFAPPEKWFESKSGKNGRVSFVDMEPGRYLVRRAPDLPRENWQPLEPNAANSPDIVTVSSGKTSKHTLHVEDTASLIRGEVVDADTAKRVAKVTITLTGDVTGGKKVTVPASNDGAFTVDWKGIGYGSFKIECGALPKGYLSATDYTGIREAGVRLEPIVIRLSKKPPARR
jgi:hypothetical protein